MFAYLMHVTCVLGNYRPLRLHLPAFGGSKSDYGAPSLRFGRWAQSVLITQLSLCVIARRSTVITMELSGHHVNTAHTGCVCGLNSPTHSF